MAMIRSSEVSRKRVYGEPGTLYGSCGGVFGVSAFVDKCMDKWMADDLLNSNLAVRTWHETAQRPGFKFLVVQIVCQLTGGPQVYTGRPMDTVHKHLNINQDQWDKFMELFNEVCEACGLNNDMVGDLNALMISMEEECVVQPGETVPPNPGPNRPRGSTLYARMGGVYPIAQFSDRLVDALLADDRVHIPTDDHKRNEASLKYLFTELLCSAGGGPEVRTSPDYPETYLLIPKAEWPILVATANAAADHLDIAVRPSLIQLLQTNRQYMVDPASPDAPSVAASSGSAPPALHAAVVKDLRASAAGVKQATRALGLGASVAARLRVFGDPRTLYGRGGGVFGLAKLANRLMDQWMGDAVLNANASVAKWHESQQSSGFKFLVTQLLGYLTGGPQRYTGQSMETAHKHLGINDGQWQSFVADAQRVFAEFQLDSSVQRELLEIIQGFQASCSVRPGEEVPPDPGMCRRKPNGASNYSNLGGVYPIALFVDRLVEEVLKGERVVVQWDRLDSPGVRHPPGLKYMLTELLCNSLGGPEAVTCKGFEEAKLGVKVEEWDGFMEVVGNVAKIWPTQHHRCIVSKALDELKVHICVGLSEDGANERARQALHAANFDTIVKAAALDHCQGDAAKALELLQTGWTPESEGRLRRVDSNTTLASVDDDAPMLDVEPAAASQGSACPFLRAASTGNNSTSNNSTSTGFFDSAAEAAHVLFECGRSDIEICELLGMTEDALRNALSHDRYASAARVLAQRKVPREVICEKLNMTEARVSAALSRHGAANKGRNEMMRGRVLGNELQQRLDMLLNEDSELCCPVTLVVFVEPVIASDGFMYERASLTALIRNRQASPMTREDLSATYFPANQKKSEVMAFREKRSDELLKFATDAISNQPPMAVSALERVQEYLDVLKPQKVPGLAKRAASLWLQAGRQPPASLAQFGVQAI